MPRPLTQSQQDAVDTATARERQLLGEAEVFEQLGYVQDAVYRRRQAQQYADHRDAILAKAATERSV